MADGGLTTALVISSVLAAGATAYSASQMPGAPKAPKPPVKIKAPDTAPLLDQGRKRLAAGGLQSTILTSPLGLPPPSAGYATKLGA